MRTSPGPGGSTVTIVTSSGFFASQATAALHVMGLPAVFVSSSRLTADAATGDLRADARPVALQVQVLPCTRRLEHRRDAKVSATRPDWRDAGKVLLTCCRGRSPVAGTAEHEVRSAIVAARNMVELKPYFLMT
mmetsp:Transcript_3275/g.8237  ORF Transcript_3275/g.8237 Transcript_3275/m.8237 type:complete len:134 (-) Transcript_3275:58-459(-)